MFFVLLRLIFCAVEPLEVILWLRCPFFGCFNRPVRRLNARSLDPFGIAQAEILNHQLRMPRISFVLNAFLRDRDHPVEDAHLLGLSVLFQPAMNLQLERLRQLLFVPIQIFTESQDCQIVSMYDQAQATLFVVEAKRTPFPKPETHPFQGSSVGLFPDHTRIHRAVHALRLLNQEGLG